MNILLSWKDYFKVLLNEENARSIRADGEPNWWKK